nr:pentatricopeptide repeat-containing protein At4g18975, chloroplastic-like isoform X1 [Ipomoea batatas]
MFLSTRSKCLDDVDDAILLLSVLIIGVRVDDLLQIQFLKYHAPRKKAMSFPLNGLPNGKCRKLYFREEQRKNEHHLWKKRDSAGSGQKALNLVRIASHSWSVGFALIDLLGRVGRRGALVNWKTRRKLQDKFQAALLPVIGRLDGLEVRSYCDGERRIGNVLLVRDGRE